MPVLLFTTKEVSENNGSLCILPLEIFAVKWYNNKCKVRVRKVRLQRKGVLIMAMEKFTREYCKAHGIKCRILKSGELQTYSPITRHYVGGFCNINGKTENEIRVAIERHIAIFLH